MKPSLRYLAIAGAMGGGGGVVVNVSSVYEDWPMPANVGNVGPGAPYLTSTTVFADGGIMQGSVGL